MALRDLAGMLLNALGSVLIVSTLVLQSFMSRAGVPYCACVGTANIVLAFGLGAVVRQRRLHAAVRVAQLKWLWMRGFFGCMTYFLLVLAMALGAPLGDVSALGSVNVVVAALAGRAFLGESLHSLHYVALVCTVAGACLIAKPETLFGHAPPGRGGAPWLGYAAAVGSGVCYGGIFISARRSQKVSPVLMMLSVAFHESLVFWLVGVSGLVHEPPLSSVATAPRSALLSLALMVSILGGATLATSAGAQMCPAAVSSTVYTSVSMSCGYAAQMALHGRVPDPLTLLGAALMLLAVVLMAAGRCLLRPPATGPAPCSAPSADGGARPEGVEGPAADLAGADGDEVESLASFIASEFSGLSLSPRETSTRQRRVRALSLAPPFQTVGVAASA